MASLTFGHGFEWTPGVGNGQGVLACCGSGGHKELDTSKRLNRPQQKNCMDWTSPTHHRRAACPTQSTDSYIHLVRKHPCRRHPGTVSSPISRHVEWAIMHVEQLSNGISLETLRRAPTGSIMYHNVSGNIINWWAFSLSRVQCEQSIS